MKWPALLPSLSVLAISLAPIGAEIPTGLLATETRLGQPTEFMRFNDHEVSAEFRRGSETGTVTEYGDGSLIVQFPSKLPWISPLWMVLRPDGDGWRDQLGDRWSAGAAAAATAPLSHPGWTPLKVTVTGDHDETLGKFQYRYSITSTDGAWSAPAMGFLDAEDSFEIAAPGNCKIDFTVRHPDVRQGYGAGIETLRKDNAPELTAKAPMGITQRGRVTAGKTGEAVPGAWVFPAIPYPPSIGPDLERGVRVAQDGSYTLRGISPEMGVVATNAKGVEVGAERTESMNPIVIRLSATGYFAGSFRDSYNKPALSKMVGGKPVRGKLFMSDGSAPQSWQVMCETSHGVWTSGRSAPGSEGGGFSIPAGSLAPDKEGKRILAAFVPGAAPMVMEVAAKRLTPGTLQIKLLPGHRLSATVKVPDKFEGPLAIELGLSIRAGENNSWPWPVRWMATQTSTANPGQPLEFDHVADGSYLLTIRGHGLGTVTRTVNISGKDAALGEILCQEPGSLAGTIHWRDLNLPFAQGIARPAGGGPLVEFNTDEEGNFRIAGLPAGDVEIEFSRVYGDVWVSCSATTIIEPGKETVLKDTDFKKP